MSEHESRADNPFSGHGEELVNVKFFRGRRDDVITAEEIHAQMHSAVMQRRLKTATVTADAPRSLHESINVREFVANL